MKQDTQQKKTAGGAPLPEYEFTKRIGGLQRTASVCTVLAVAGILGCVAVLLFAQNPLLAAALFAAAAAGIWVGSSTQKRIKSLVHNQMGDIFRAELEKAFGPEPRNPELPIDEAFLRTSQLTGRVWETCEIRNFHEGVHRGVRFSAANVILEHVYQQFQPHEGTQTCRQKMLGGIVIRCKTVRCAPGRIFVRAHIEPDEPDGIRTCDEAFNRRFLVEAASQSDALSLLTPQFLASLKALEASFRDELEGLIWDGDVLTLAINTAYVFADVPDALDARKPETLAAWYAASLKGMQNALDILMEHSALFSPE